MSSVFGLGKVPVDQRQRNVQRQQNESRAQQTVRQIKLDKKFLQTAEAQDRDRHADRAHRLGHLRTGQRRLADEEERHEHQQVFQPDQQRRIIPETSPREKNRRQHQQHFVALHRSEIENQSRGFVIEKRRVNGNAVAAEQQQ